MNTIIVKLPDEIDPNNILKSKIKEYGSKCPYCGETNHFENYNGKPKGIEEKRDKSWYGRQYEYSPTKDYDNMYWTDYPNWRIVPLKYLKEKKRFWKIKTFKCYTCGTVWSTPAYPKDVTDNMDLELINEIFYSIKDNEIDKVKLIGKIDDKLTFKM